MTYAATERPGQLAWGLAAAIAAVLNGCSPAAAPDMRQSASSRSAQSGVIVQTSDPAVYRGAGLAHLGCPQCHDIGVVGAGPATKTAAPDFISIANRQGMTAQHIEQWMQQSHPTMPGFYLDDATDRDLAAYIMSLRRTSR